MSWAGLWANGLNNSIYYIESVSKLKKVQTWLGLKFYFSNRAESDPSRTKSSPLSLLFRWISKKKCLLFRYLAPSPLSCSHLALLWYRALALWLDLSALARSFFHRSLRCTLSLSLSLSVAMLFVFRFNKKISDRVAINWYCFVIGTVFICGFCVIVTFVTWIWYKIIALVRVSTITILSGWYRYLQKTISYCLLV